eukprot:scaffold1667_cov258-Pinguiococcus_pyrenoidosus.AAC.18
MLIRALAQKVEITPFCHEHTRRLVEALPSVAGCKAILRLGSSSSNQPDGDEPAVTDNGNYIVDLHFTEPIKVCGKRALGAGDASTDAKELPFLHHKDPVAAANELKNTVGVVDHGLFCDMTTAVIVAGSEGIYVKEA